MKIAEAVLVPVYGDEKIRSEEPFGANLEGDIWTVSGTLYCLDGKVGMCPGGTATVKISKNDARILFMMQPRPARDKLDRPTPGPGPVWRVWLYGVNTNQGLTVM